MNRDITYLRSIVKYCENIEEAIRTFGNDDEDFLSDVLYQSSCAFSLLQIGEIVKRLTSELRLKYSGTEWSDIAKLRDVISHRYEGINLRLIWEMITSDVPSLKRDCESILTELTQS